MRIVSVLAAGAMLALAGVGAIANDAPDGKTGLKVGSKAPSFKLRDQTGQERSLDDFLKSSDKVAIVFHRSAGW